MKKTLRLIITLDCNLSCEYCCNKIPKVNSKFVTKRLEEIDFEQYEAVCITGGEPLLRRDLIDEIIETIPLEIPVYLYTNGILLEATDLYFAGINIGVHCKHQKINYLNKKITLYVQDIHREEYLPNIPDKYIKTWTMNDCFNNVETEDWVLLKE